MGNATAERVTYAAGVPVEIDQVAARVTPRDDGPREARRIASAFLLQHGIDDYVKDLAAIVTAELVTNAVLHGAEPINFRVRLFEDAVAVEVTDRDERDETLEALQLPHSETRGRGLAIVQSLTRRWGVTHHPYDGKTVWGEIAIPGA